MGVSVGGDYTLRLLLTMMGQNSNYLHMHLSKFVAVLKYILSRLNTATNIVEVQVL